MAVNRNSDHETQVSHIPVEGPSKAVVRFTILLHYSAHTVGAAKKRPCGTIRSINDAYAPAGSEIDCPTRATLQNVRCRQCVKLTLTWQGAKVIKTGFMSKSKTHRLSAVYLGGISQNHVFVS